MRDSEASLDSALTGSFSRFLLVDVLHGSDRVERDVYVEDWELPGDLGRDPKTTGRMRIVHASVKGESWVPKGTKGVLSPFKATLVVTEVIQAGGFERRIQLGLFDVVGVTYAQDTYARVTTTGGDQFPLNDMFPADDMFPFGQPSTTYAPDIVIASTVEVEVESLDGRVLGASFRAPRKSASTALAEWRKVGILPVAVSADAALPATTWPAEQGSRLNDVQDCARILGGVPVVDSFGQWTLADDNTPTVELHLGENGTVVDVQSELTLDGFYNVVVGTYEDPRGRPLLAEWVATGDLSPEVMGRELVRYHSSDMVRTQAQANAAVASIGEQYTYQEVDVEVTCVYNPLLELGDHVVIEEAGVYGIARQINASASATMTVIVRVRRSL
jgi:hypothetical protein